MREKKRGRKKKRRTIALHLERVSSEAQKDSVRGVLSNVVLAPVTIFQLMCKSFESQC
jgi:hypothetical protein